MKMPVLHRLGGPLLSALLVFSATMAALPGTAVSAKGAPTSLYLVQPGSEWALLPLDPETLVDDTRFPSIPTGVPAHPHCLGTCGSPWIASSADGTVVASALYPYGPIQVANRGREITIRLYSAWTAENEGEFHPRVPLIPLGVFARGSRLYGLQPGPTQGNVQLPPWRAWYTLDIADGTVLARVDLHDWGVATRYDPARHRLYVLREILDGKGTRPKSATLLAYGARSGRLVNRLPLPDVPGGSWTNGKTIQGWQEFTRWDPGFALSPDGRTIALLDGQSNRLTLVDAVHMTVIRTTILSRTQSLLEWVGRWLGIFPETALAKAEDGMALNLVFAPDGKRLYAWGGGWVLHADGSVTRRTMALSVVELDHGEITAQAQADEGWLGLSPDGRFLYTLAQDGRQWILQRDNPQTLQVLAQRRFDSYPQLAVLGTSRVWP